MSSPKQRPPHVDPKQRPRHGVVSKHGRNHPKCVCSQPLTDNAYLCRECMEKLRKLLIGVPSLAEAAAITYTRRARMTARTSGSRAAESQLPFVELVRRDADRLAVTIGEWTARILPHRTILDVGPICHQCHHASCKRLRAGRPPSPNAISMARWLLWNLPWIRRQPYAPDLLNELRRATGRVDRRVDLAPDRWYLGPCRAEYTHVGVELDRRGDPRLDADDIPVEYSAPATCLNEIYALPGTVEFSCRRCDTVHDVNERRSWLLKYAEDMLASTTLIARALTRLGEPVTADRIRQWKHRGRIQPHTVTIDDTEQEWFRIGDVIELVHQHAASEARRAEKNARRHADIA